MSISKKNWKIKTEHKLRLELSTQVTEIQNKLENANIFHMYDEAKTLLDEIFYPPFLNKFFNQRGRIYFLYSDFEMGKSFLAQYAIALLENEFPEYWNNENKGFVFHPAIYLRFSRDVKGDISFLHYLANSLRIIIDPKILREWERQKIQRQKLVEKIVNWLINHKTRILIFDEIQRMSANSIIQVPEIFEAMKDLTDSVLWNKSMIKTRFVMIGTPEGIAILEASDFIQNRVSVHTINGLSKEQYIDFLEDVYYSFRLDFGLPKNWGLYREIDDEIEIVETHLQILFERSKSDLLGDRAKIGATVVLIEEAVQKALSKNRLKITENDLLKVLKTDADELVLDIHETNSKGLIKVILDLDNLTCDLCPSSSKRSKEPYKQSTSLIKHMINSHDGFLIVNKDGVVIRRKELVG